MKFNPRGEKKRVWSDLKVTDSFKLLLFSLRGDIALDFSCASLSACDHLPDGICFFAAGKGGVFIACLPFTGTKNQTKKSVDLTFSLL